MSAASKIPPLRFKGFEGAWEAKRLERLVKKRNESAESGDVPKLEYEDVVSFEGVLKRSLDQLYVVKRGTSFYVGDVLYGKLRPYLGNWFLAPFNGVAVGDWWVLKPDGIDSECLYALIQTEAFQVAANQSTGSKMPRADWNLVSETLYSIPLTIGEQQKIGSTFRSLDALIADRESAVEKLQTLKKAMLEKMFPRAGAKVPEVRFKGCEGEWKEKRLGDTFSMSVSTNTLSRACLTEEGTVRNVHYGDILTKLKSVTNANSEELPYVADNDFKTSTKNLLQDGDVVMADTAEDAMVGKVTEIQNVGCAQVVAGLHTVVLRPLDDFGAGYLGYYLNSDAFHLGLLRIMQGVKVLSINKSFLADYSLLFPSLHEQRKIGAYFRSLDVLISARQEEVGKLKDLKKGLLDRMFV